MSTLIDLYDKIVFFAPLIIHIWPGAEKVGVWSGPWLTGSIYLLMNIWSVSLTLFRIKMLQLYIYFNNKHTILFIKGDIIFLLFRLDIKSLYYASTCNCKLLKSWYKSALFNQISQIYVLCIIYHFLKRFSHMAIHDAIYNIS